MKRASSSPWATFGLARTRNAVRWLIPATTLALIPKCPACFAAYVAAATGLGMSLPLASKIRLGLMAMCLAALAYLIFRQAVRYQRRWTNGMAPRHR